MALPRRDPNNRTGDLKLSVNGSRDGVYGTNQDLQLMALKSVLMLAEIHGLYAVNWRGENRLILSAARQRPGAYRAGDRLGLYDAPQVA